MRIFTEEKRLFVAELCKRSLYHFVEIVINHRFPKKKVKPLQPFHKKILDTIQDDTIKRHGILTPRFFLKSHNITQSKPIWDYIRDHEERIGIVNEIDSRACEFVGFTKGEFEENEFMHYLYPETKMTAEWMRKKTWCSEAIVLPREGNYKDPTIKAFGVGGASQGFHGTRLYLDDIFGRNALLSADIRMKTKAWFGNTDELLVEPDFFAPDGSYIYLIGTHYCLGDIYCTTQEEHKEYVWHIVPAEDEFGNPTWPERLSAEMIQYYKTTKPLVFYTQMQNDPKESGLSEFREEWLKKYERYTDAETKREWVRYAYTKQKPDGTFETVYRDVEVFALDIMAVIDPAVSEPSIKNTCRTAIMIIGTDPETGKRIMLEAWAKRIGQPSELYAQVFEFQDKYPLMRWGIETFGQQNWVKKGIMERAEVLGRHITISSLNKDVGANAKHIRITSAKDPCSNGDVYIRDSFLDFIAEYKSYPMGDLVDLMDCLGYHALEWNPKPTPGMLADSQERYQDFVSGRGEMGY
jgi:hypothetical protein